MADVTPARRHDSSSAEAAVRIHRALSSVTRVRLFRLLEGGPRDIAGLVEATGLHYNTVRNHLEILTRAELVARAEPPTGRPGRPNVVYRLADPPTDPSDARARGSRALLETLMALVEQHLDEPVRVTAQAAEPVGRAELPDGPQPTTFEQALARIVELLGHLGFEPELRQTEDGSPQVLLRHCPFDDLARRYGDIVCSAHVGIIRGALAELGADVDVDLRPFVEPALCIVGLQPAEAASSPSTR